MGIRRILQEWREKVDGTLTGPAIETDSATVSGTTTTETLEAGISKTTNVGVYVGLSSPQTIPNDTMTQLTWDASISGVDSEVLSFDTANNQIVVEEDGDYMVFTSAEGEDFTDGTSVDYKLSVNGNTKRFKFEQTESTFSTGVEISFYLKDLNAGDAITTSLNHQEASDVNIRSTSDTTYLQVVRVS
jgi:hypothetical protein